MQTNEHRSGVPSIGESWMRKGLTQTQTSKCSNVILVLPAAYRVIIVSGRGICATWAFVESRVVECTVITWNFCLLRGDPSLRTLEGTPRGVSDLAYSPATSPIRISYLRFLCCPFWGPCLDIRRPFCGIIVVGVVTPSSVNRSGFPTGFSPFLNLYCKPSM
jgi:hypothetical protein